MAKPIPTRDYSCSDADLKQRADKLADSITRDLTYFAARNVTDSTVTAFKARITDFDGQPTKEEMQYDIALKTKAKDDARKALEAQIRILRSMVGNVLGTTSTFYNFFGFDNFNKLSDAQMYRMAKTAKILAQKQITLLAPEGCTVDFLADIVTLNATFDDAIDDIEEAQYDAEKATEVRVISGNTLFTELSRLCNIGKTIFADVDPVTYNDYLIYENEQIHTLGVVTNLNYNGTMLTFGNVTGATGYEVQSSQNETTWNTIGYPTTTSAPIPNLQIGGLYFRVRATKAPNIVGEWSDSYLVIYGLDIPGEFLYYEGLMTWQSAQYANGYDIERTEAANINWVLIYNSNGTSFVNNPGDGAWKYRIRSSYGATKSDWVTIDVIVP
jgi:hypothetical protein